MRCSIRGGPGTIPPRTMHKRARSQDCSRRISSSSRAPCPLRCERPAPNPKARIPSPSFEVVRDPIWNNIRLEPEALAVMDTPVFQRLRYVRQLGHAFLVYPGATHTRFEHALGAYHLAGRVLDALEDAGDVRPDPTERARLKLAALLHDIGHYPFSHALEEAGLPRHEALAARH